MLNTLQEEILTNVIAATTTLQYFENTAIIPAWTITIIYATTNTITWEEKQDNFTGSPYYNNVP